MVSPLPKRVAFMQEAGMALLPYVSPRLPSRKSGSMAAQTLRLPVSSVGTKCQSIAFLRGPMTRQELTRALRARGITKTTHPESDHAAPEVASDVGTSPVS